MKTYENKVVPPLNEVEDLTLFLDEDFDTDEVDLFEFTNATDSPLRQLKAIVLSLDWEITAATLEELSQEIRQLRELEIFHNDQVSQIYLQGLDKVGSYIRAEQAYAHPNAMKLLLTLYYDFEKIISSADITGPEITGLLKADVRKFKILQYQIAQTSKNAGPESPVISASGQPAAATDRLQSLQKLYAIILGLDWEVTDQGLQSLAEQLDVLQKHFADDRYMLILIQGLNALRLYIADERANAHPEAFSLVHFFYEGLRLLAEGEDLNTEKRRAILTERVNSLNNLKLLIVSRAETVESAPEKGELPSEKTQEDEITPALADTMGDSPLNAEKERAADPAEVPEGLEEKIDSFFGDENETPKSGMAGEEVKGEESIEIISENDFLPEEENITLETAEVSPTLAEAADQGAGDDKEAPTGTEQLPAEELEDNLELFFGEEEEPPDRAAEAGAGNSSMETITENDFLSEEESITLETVEITPALAGLTDEGAGDEREAPTGTGQLPPEELEEKLESFFGSDDKEQESEALSGEEMTADEPEEAEDTTAALAQATRDDELNLDEHESGTEADKQPSEELEENLELFFGEEEEPPDRAAEAGAGNNSMEAITEYDFLTDEDNITLETIEITPALAGLTDEGAGDEREAPTGTGQPPPEELEEKLESFFGSDDKEQEPEADSPATEKPEERLETIEDYKSLLKRMQVEFAERENALKQEIESLREMIQSQ